VVSTDPRAANTPLAVRSSRAVALTAPPRKAWRKRRLKDQASLRVPTTIDFLCVVQERGFIHPRSDFFSPTMGRAGGLRRQHADLRRSAGRRLYADRRRRACCRSAGRPPYACRPSGPCAWPARGRRNAVARRVRALSVRASLERSRRNAAAQHAALARDRRNAAGPRARALPARGKHNVDA
jgi:hypothetical protein